MGHEEGEISIWDIGTLIAAKKDFFNPAKVVKGLHFDAVRDVNFSGFDIVSNSFKLISGSFDTKVKIWSVGFGEGKKVLNPFDVDVDVIQTLSKISFFLIFFR